MRVKDTDYLYATTRLRSLERELVTAERAERMLEAKTPEDTAKILTEAGFDEITPVTAKNVELALSKNRADTIALFKSIVKDSRLAELFCVKYDYHNIKTILKSDALGKDSDHILIATGNVPLGVLTQSVREGVYRDLPENMRGAVALAREVLARTGDPQQADLILDRACFEDMLRLAQATHSEFAQKYVALLIDISNLRSTVRAGRMSKSSDFLSQALIEGGTVTVSRFMMTRTSGVTVRDIFASTILESAAEAGTLAISGETDFLAFEKYCDDAIIEFSKSAKFVAFGEAPAVAFMLAKEAETTTVRIIMSGKLAGLSREEIRNRLRLSYV